MTRTIALVACVSKKNRGPRPARELYASDWFRKASAYAEQVSDEWYILSAKYGLVSPSTYIEPYDETLNNMSSAVRVAWEKKVLGDLRSRLNSGDRVVILAGNKYREHIVQPMRSMCCIVEIPMEGLRIGEQLSWLSRQLNQLRGSRDI